MKIINKKKECTEIQKMHSEHMHSEDSNKPKLHKKLKNLLKKSVCEHLLLFSDGSDKTR